MFGIVCYNTHYICNMSEKKEPKKRQERTEGGKYAASWKFDAEILDMLDLIAKDEKESQAYVLRSLIKKEFKRKGLKLD